MKDAASVPGCPAAQQTIYAYERGGLVPSLKQFMELVEFYATNPNDRAEPRVDVAKLRYQGVAALTKALTMPAYHFTEALDLIQRLQPTPPRGRRRPVRSVKDAAAGAAQ